VSDQIKPILLLADSQAFFRKDDKNRPLLHELINSIEPEFCNAVYIGASNGDAPEFYEIFELAMDGLGVKNCKQIFSEFNEADQKALSNADIILLAGGSVVLGQEILDKTGMKALIIEKRSKGCILIGVSAGAVLLGCEYFKNPVESDDNEIIEGLKLIPANIGAHDEANDWTELKYLLKYSNGMQRGLGLPFGSGILYHADNTFAIIGKPIAEFVNQQGTIKEAVIY
jgi:peptidase E